MRAAIAIFALLGIAIVSAFLRDDRNGKVSKVDVVLAQSRAVDVVIDEMPYCAIVERACGLHDCNHLLVKPTHSGRCRTADALAHE